MAYISFKALSHAFLSCFFQKSCEEGRVVLQIIDCFCFTDEEAETVDGTCPTCKGRFGVLESKNCFDTTIAAYLLNPLKSEYPYDDIAKDYLNLMVILYTNIKNPIGWKIRYGEQDFLMLDDRK